MLIEPPIFEWCVIRCEFKNGHQKGIMRFERDWAECSKFDNYSSSIVNIIGDPIWLFKKKENLHFHYEYHVRTSSEEDEENGYSLDLGLLIIS